MTQEELTQRKAVIQSLMEDPAYVPMKLKELAILLDMPKTRREELKEVLDALLEEGKVGVSKRGKYGQPQAQKIQGLFFGHPKGFGFVAVEGMEQDIFIPGEYTAGALHGDTVQIQIQPGSQGRRTQGQVVGILDHANQEVVGYYKKSKNFGFVVPDNQKLTRDIFIPQGKDMGAVTGHKVVVRVTDFGQNSKNPEGAVVEILGHANDPGTDILSIARAFCLPEEFPPQVMSQLDGIPDQVDPKDLAGRLDLRDLQTVTIDGEDAKDLDDGITISKDGDIYHLGVHIADVSHYVGEGTEIDQEALNRGTSVYLVDRVIPMLPHKLSNGICSLNQGEDRLALSCLMDIDGQGAVIGHRIAETVIQVDRRMTYRAVNAILTGQEEAPLKEYQEFVPMFQLMKDLAHLLRKKRKARGSIDFDFPESKIILDEKGRPQDILPYDRNVATKLIEEFMLAANETVAEDYFWQDLPFLYRTHDKPDPDRMKSFAAFINNFGYSIRFQNGEVYPKEVQKLLVRVEDTPEEALISRLALRSMKQARYGVDSTGHFGLAAKYYAHFTSPIRRYPDLQIHRIIKENLHGGLDGRRREHYQELLPKVAAQSSAQERKADEAERETNKLKKCQYMSKRLGQEYEGVISGVANWGFYVELPNTVEGLVHVNALKDDYYHFDEEHYQLVGERTKRAFKLGQAIRIQVAAADQLMKTIDFIPAKKEEE